jgi:hypothetical protein
MFTSGLGALGETTIISRFFARLSATYNRHRGAIVSGKVLASQGITMTASHSRQCRAAREAGGGAGRAARAAPAGTGPARAGAAGGAAGAEGRLSCAGAGRASSAGGGASDGPCGVPGPGHGRDARQRQAARHRDAKAFRAFAAERQALLLAERQAALSLPRQQEVEALETGRQLRALGKVEARERQALEVRRVRKQRIIERHGHDHMPALKLDLKPKGRGAAVRRAKDRYRDRSGAEEREVQQVPQEERREERDGRGELQQALQAALAREQPWSKEVDLAGDFAKAAGDGDGDGEVRGGDEDGERLRISRAERKSERRRGRDDDFERES